MSQPILHFTNHTEFLPLVRPNVVYHYTGANVEESMAFYRIIRTTISDQNSITYLLNKRLNSATWEVRLESDKQTVHSVEITNNKLPTLNFYRKKIHSSIRATQLAGLGIIVSIIFAGFKFFRGINRVSWLLPGSALAISSIGLIYATTLQRKAFFGFVNVLATIVDLKVNNISITHQENLLCNDSNYKKHPVLRCI